MGGVPFLHGHCLGNRTGSEVKKKGGENNEKESITSNTVLLSSTLLWGVPTLRAEVVGGQESIVKEPAGDTVTRREKMRSKIREARFFHQEFLDGD